MSGDYGYCGPGGTHRFDTPEERDEFAEIFDDRDEIEPWRERFYDEVEGENEWKESWWRKNGVER